MTAPGMSRYPNTYYEDLHITEKQKSELDYLKTSVDHWIANLVQSKSHIRTYRDYYNGVRDNSEFEYLTENFGIGTPSSLKFTNIIKPRIDALVAQLESDNYTYNVSCTDDKSINLIQQEKKDKKLQEIEQAMDMFTKNMRRSLEQQQEPVPFSDLLNSVNKVKEKYSTNFISDFEIAAQKVCVYFERSNEMELRLKLAILVHDLAVTGECYYRVHFKRYGADPILIIIKPENFFHNKNTDNPFLGGTDAVAHRRYLTHKEVATEYGKYMNADQMRELFGGQYMSKTARNLNSGLDLEIYYSENDPMLGQKFQNSAYTVEVIHVEWKATNEVTIDEDERDRLQLLNSGIKYKIGEKVRRTDRYEGTRIGGTVYVNCGKSEQVVRSSNDPYICDFSYGGLLNNDRNGKPYSIVGALKDLQDIYDLTMFHRDNLIANSGVKGDRINIAGIPKVLGDDFMTRLFKFIALKKNGVELIDPTEHGAQLFNHYGNFDNTVDGNSLQAINGIMEQVERQADIIAGTNPQMLGNIQEREAVSNVRVGIKQSMMINQPLFEMFRGNQNRIMGSLVNMAQMSYKNGKKISWIAGGESFVFDLLPDKFAFSDYAIAISYASKDTAKVEQLRALSKELISGGMLDPDIMVKVLLSDSVTEISQLVSANFNKKKIENDQLGQLTSQNEQLQTQLKELQSELNNLSQQLQAAKDAGNDIKAKEIEMKHAEALKKLELEETKVINLKDFNDATIDLKGETVQLEREQLYMDTGNAQEIRNM